MHSGTCRLAACLLPVIILAGCNPASEQRTAGLLNHRLETNLRPDIAASRVAVQPTRNGAVVTFLDTSSVPGGPLVSDQGQGSVRASVIESLLDPSLMSLTVADSSYLPPDLKLARTESLTQYLQVMAPGARIEPMAPSEAASPEPGGLTLTISVLCPRRHDGAGYDDGRVKPDCF